MKNSNIYRYTTYANHLVHIALLACFVGSMYGLPVVGEAAALSIWVWVVLATLGMILLTKEEIEMADTISVKVYYVATVILAFVSGWVITAAALLIARTLLEIKIRN